ncbi:MAG: FAD-dependent oxidoreductase [Hydrogenovibrio sp.]|uniref:NAD(P)/FAD-dependent oxidoreductase n=1 Tax=Hydrogenovibrio sp. TaxID=2065821 RepID=UPI00287032F4|nr:FAD-dependent oxidoreductase [Hydrogenovibrio sp.]MDR9498800.1 FAD-dependent oxidoreductase [Hydrogenovibrio sp.]
MNPDTTQPKTFPNSARHPSAPQKIAVIGSGISGLASAWFLSQKHHVTLFEKNDYTGGHTHTVEMDHPQFGRHAVDTGFIVYNEPNYPHLTAMLRHLGVATQATTMSFGVSINQGQIEYSGDNLNTLFAQRRNLLSPAHWNMLTEIVRFNRIAKRDLSLNRSQLAQWTLGEYLDQHKFSPKMRNHYLLPMAAAIWSCPTGSMLEFPASSFLQFFDNHGLLNIHDRPQWQTVCGGSCRYVEKILGKQAFKHRLNTPIARIHPKPETQSVELTTLAGQTETFDQVVVASHADQSLQMIDPAWRPDFGLLNAFEYQTNLAYLHTDLALMPKRRRTWAAWNYLRQDGANEDRVAVTYWMNRLQSIDSAQPLLVTLNPTQAPDPAKVVKTMKYEHPVFNQVAMAAQKRLGEIQGLHGLWFAGAWTGYGFHEDGLRSAVHIARQFDLNLPWEAAGTGSVTTSRSGPLTSANDSESHADWQTPSAAMVGANGLKP